MKEGAGRKLLFVDDDADFLLQNKVRFETAGYAVTTADGPAAGRAAAAEVRPDLVVVDLMMGDMDAGIVLAHKLKKDRPDLPIILVTGVTRETGLVFEGTSDDERRWLRVDQVLAKPVRFEQLRTAVESLLARARPGTSETKP